MFGVFLGGLDGSKWKSVGAGVHYILIVYGATLGGLDGSRWKLVGAGVPYIQYLVPLGEG